MLAVVAAIGLLGLALGWLGALARFMGGVALALAAVLTLAWFLFALFTLYFFRDPDPNTPGGPGLVVSPGHGKVDVIEQLAGSQFPGGPCHRISMFLSVIDIHVQNAPVGARIACVTHTRGRFLSAMRAESALENENVLVGLDSTETPGEKIGLRLIAGVLARRIVPFVAPGDLVQRGERISLIQFGSRCDLYLPLAYKINVKTGDHVVGGQTVMASKS
jgi:phosphatidylserine decarboxylase